MFSFLQSGEALTAAHRAGVAMIASEGRRQDDLLDEISTAVQDLDRRANTIRDELQVSNVVRGQRTYDVLRRVLFLFSFSKVCLG